MTKDEFIEKWSAWFVLHPDYEKLKEAMRKELEELIKEAKNEN